MCLISLFFAVVAVVLVYILVRQRQKRLKEKVPLYVCPECGEHNCNCYLKEEVDRTPERKNNDK